MVWTAAQSCMLVQLLPVARLVSGLYMIQSEYPEGQSQIRLEQKLAAIKDLPMTFCCCVSVAVGLDSNPAQHHCCLLFALFASARDWQLYRTQA